MLGEELVPFPSDGKKHENTKIDFRGKKRKKRA